MAILDYNNVRYIVIHCSATKPMQNIGAAEIDSWHKSRGWNGIGYHFVVRRNKNSIGSLLERGRNINTIGAHVKNHNYESIGICVVGGIDYSGNPEANYTQEQYNTLFWVVKYLKEVFPNAIVQGHRDFPGVRKACPCFDVKTWWNGINQSVYLPIGTNPGNSWTY